MQVTTTQLLLERAAGVCDLDLTNCALQNFEVIFDKKNRMV